MSYISLPHDWKLANKPADVVPKLFGRCLLIVAACISGGCRCEKDSTPSASRSAHPHTSSTLPALRSDTSVLRLGSETDSNPVWLLVPQGATEPRPLVMVQHGFDSEARSLCEGIVRLTEQSVFVLCQALGARLHSQANHPSMGAPQPSASQAAGMRQPPELAAAGMRRALKETKRRFGSHLARGPVVFVGAAEDVRPFLRLIRSEPSFFSRFLLIGGRFDGWPAGVATRFGAQGGKRAVFSSGAGAGFAATAHRATLVKRGGAEARAVEFEQPRTAAGVLKLLEQQWSWLVAEDERFRASRGGR